MVEKTIKVTAEHGLHVRPAAQLVKLSKQFESSVILEVGESSSTAKSLFKLQTLPIKKDTNVKIICEGSDEANALEKVVELLEGLK